MTSKYNKNLKFQLKREKAFLREVRRKNKQYPLNQNRNKAQLHQLTSDIEIIKRSRELYFQDLEPFIDIGSGDVIIDIPEDFSFDSGYSKSIRAIKSFATSLFEFAGKEIVLDFSRCRTADTAALFVLQIVRLEFLERLQLLQNRLKALNVIPELILRAPKNNDVIRLLLVSGFHVNESVIKNVEQASTLKAINAMGYYKGTKSQKHYAENKKGVYATRIVNYLDSCLSHHSYMLTHDERQDLDGIIGEILNNAEDHSGRNNWFLTANFSKELYDIGDEEVGELNLTIMNFGNTVYEAFLNTKDDNHQTYLDVCGYAEKIHMQDGGVKFTEEQLFLLATMQDQVSRLKYAEESRGTGTMRFINSFMKLGDFEDDGKNFHPNLSIYSGNAHLKCDNIYKPFKKDDVFCLSLNPEMDLNRPPRDSHLTKLSEKFPGTLLSVKIYINKAHYDKKYGGSGNGKF